MAVLGLVGGPLVCSGSPGSPAQAFATLPEIAWEASLGVYLTVKGFRASAPVLGATRRTGPVTTAVAAA